MKRTMFLAAVLVLTMILAACGTEAEPIATPVPEVEEPAQEMRE